MCRLVYFDSSVHCFIENEAGQRRQRLVVSVIIYTKIANVTTPFLLRRFWNAEVYI